MKTSYAPCLQTEKSFFILNLESVQLCPSPVLPHEISAQNCAGFVAKQKSMSSWTHSNSGTWKRVLILKWKTDGLVATLSPTRHSTKIWNGLYCITWNTILCIPDPESKTIFGDSGVGRYSILKQMVRLQLDAVTGTGPRFGLLNRFLRSSQDS